MNKMYEKLRVPRSNVQLVHSAFSCCDGNCYPLNLYHVHMQSYIASCFECNYVCPKTADTAIVHVFHMFLHAYIVKIHRKVSLETTVYQAKHAKA